MTDDYVHISGRHTTDSPFAVPSASPELPVAVQAPREVTPDQVQASATVALACAPESDSDHGNASARLVDAGTDLAHAFDVADDDVARWPKFSGRAGQVAVVRAGSADAPTILAIGVGKGRDKDLFKAAAVLMAQGVGSGHLVTNIAAGRGEGGVRSVVRGLVLGSYRPSAAKAEHPLDRGFTDVDLVGANFDEIITETLHASRGTVAARNWCNMPSSIKTPRWMVDQVHKLADSLPYTTVTVWDAEEMARQGFGGITTVGQGAEVPPALVSMDYNPPNAQKHIVLVGKGVTFDTGGISLKPSDAMLLMRTDMTGSAVVLQATAVAARSAVPTRVTCLAGFAENSIGPNSFRPSDVVTTYDGTTVEVSNTDAEGRMILCDAIGYAATKLHPDVIVDVATLTGSATLGLGRVHAALFSNSDVLAEDLMASGEVADEPLWRMPLVEDYKASLESEVADLNHISYADKTVGAGAITAALFLRHFAGDTDWAHLDIAGVGRRTKSSPGFPEGPTAFGVRVLSAWISMYAQGS